VSKNSILVDFYNLELSELPGLEGRSAPIEDRARIIEFFEQHAPRVVRYRTADELKRHIETHFGSVIDISRADFVGSLGHYEWRRKESWFDSNVQNFYSWHKLVHEILDAHLEGEAVSKRHLALVSGFADDVRVTLFGKDRNGNYFGSANAPQVMDQEKYSFGETKIPIASDHSDVSKVKLGLGGMKYNFFREILDLWNGNISVGKCALSGCGRVFLLGSGRYRKKYCIDAHRVRAFRQRKAAQAASE